jgi:lamin tail-like protein
MSKRLVTGALSALATGAILIPAAPAEAAPAIQIRRVYFDSPGTDNRTNSSLNAEWIRIRNTAGTGIQLEGWKIKDRAGYTYTFGRLWLRPGSIVTVHTGRGTNTAAHRYWQRRAYVWNNTGDTAYLRRPNGALVDTCSWGSEGEWTWC